MRCSRARTALMYAYHICVREYLLPTQLFCIIHSTLQSASNPPPPLRTRPPHTYTDKRKPGPVPPPHPPIGASADLSGTSAKRPASVPDEDCVVCHTPLRQAKGVNMLPCAHMLCVSCTLHLARTKPITMQVGVLGSALSRICALTAYMVNLHRRDDHHLHQ